MEAQFKERTTKNLKARNIGRVVHKDDEMRELKQKMEEEQRTIVQQPNPQSATPQPVNVADEMARPVSDAEAIELGIIKNGYSWTDIMRGALGIGAVGLGIGAYQQQQIMNRINRDREYERQAEENYKARMELSKRASVVRQGDLIRLGRRPQNIELQQQPQPTMSDIRSSVMDSVSGRGAMKSFMEGAREAQMNPPPRQEKRGRPKGSVSMKTRVERGEVKPVSSYFGN
jgi:hypothetical protein